ncbi:DUF4386 family protein [Patulibacter minatonensis]|uniref:DUF4386 family protein n=1 Tax=Patulibacter minatonensis TaxID=298163 RepID=UPI0004793552|nr:DUF4386 family protein [Patulibacter minatonensis]
MSKKQDAKRDSDAAILDAERKTGRLVGAAAAASIVATVATLAVASSAAGGSGLPKGTVAGGDAVIDRAKVLIRFNANEAQLATATGLRVLGLLLMIVVGLFLIRLVRTRDSSLARPYLVWLTFIGPVLMSISTIAGFISYGDVADHLIALKDANGLSGKALTDQAVKLIDDSSGLRITQFGDGATRIVVAIWLALIATAAMRVGLLTRFLGYWGVAAGASLAILPGAGGDAMMAGWIGSMGVLFLGYWPGGRPLAWDSTEPQEIEAI